MDEIVKFVTIVPYESQSKKDKIKYQIQVKDLICYDNDFQINTLPWPVGEIKLDRSGMRLVVVS